MSDSESMVKGKIAYQGEVGSYHHLSCQKAYPEYESMPCKTFDDAFDAVTSGSADLAMIAIANNIGGRVAEVHSLMRNSDLQIIDEHFQPINHHLLAVEGATLETIKTVYSHEQALDQCRNFLRANGLHRSVHADTAGAARMVSENNDPTIAALASEIAGSIYGLQSLVAGAQDQKGNTTRFVVLTRRQEYDQSLMTKPCMTSLIFKVKSVPAALYKALGGFATNGVNVVKLESYIANNQFEQAEFYAEIEGHIDHTAVQLSLDELRFFSHEVKIMGVYPKHAHRLDRS